MRTEREFYVTYKAYSNVQENWDRSIITTAPLKSRSNENYSGKMELLQNGKSITVKSCRCNFVIRDRSGLILNETSENTFLSPSKIVCRDVNEFVLAIRRRSKSPLRNDLLKFVVRFFSSPFCRTFSITVKRQKFMEPQRLILMLEIR